MVVIKYREDLLIFSKWFRDVLVEHLDIDKPISVDMHVRTLNVGECDVVVKQGSKTIAIELKRKDYAKVIEQAVKRRDSFTYMYVAIDLPAYAVLAILRKYRDTLDYGIGFISTMDDCIVIRSYSRRISESKRYKTLLEVIE